jgi:hypothetical protein
MNLEITEPASKRIKREPDNITIAAELNRSESEYKGLPLGNNAVYTF